MIVSYTLHWDERPFTSNSERSMHHMKRASLVRKWREAFYFLALEAKLPQLENVSIVCSPYAKDGRWRADCGAIFPTVKAAIDGLIDAGMCEDDNPDYVKYIGFNAPIISGYDRLELEITGDEIGPALIVPKKVVVKNPKPAYNNGRRKSATRKPRKKS